MVESRDGWKKTVARRSCGKARTLIEMGGHSVMMRLVQTELSEGIRIAIDWAGDVCSAVCGPSSSCHEKVSP